MTRREFMPVMAVGAASVLRGQSAGTLDGIRTEAARQNDDPAGRPLPLVGHWNTGIFKTGGGGFNPDYQVEAIKNGNYLLMWFEMPWLNSTASKLNLRYYEKAIGWAASQSLPISFVSTQWERILYDWDQFYGLPAEQNPNVINLDGTIRRQLDPMGPVDPWTEGGRLWSASPIMQKLQELYPNPPLVVFVSNNEASRLWWPDVEASKRYIDTHGLGKAEDFRRSVVANGWIPRYRALQTGLRSGLGPAWAGAAKFVGYDAFGPPHFGRWVGWHYYALPFDQYIDPAPLMWDGGSPSFYLHNWNPSRDDQVWGPQGEAQNWVPMLREAQAVNPQFWFEFSVWDGDQAKRDTLSDVGPFTPERYGAMTELGMWLLTPRIVREFRAHRATARENEQWLNAILERVRRVHQNPTLQRFWRNGRLVTNTSRLHPYQALTEYVADGTYANAERWFLLNTTLDSPETYSFYTRLPVLCIARELGASPQREWLVYCHAPQGQRAGVGVAVPGFGQAVLDIPVAGAFYLLREGDPTPVRVS